MQSVTTALMIRFSKIIMALSFGGFAAVVVFGNVTDYNSNFNFVTHVLSMDTTYPGNTIMYRAITTPWMHHAAYWGIIATELVIMALCLKGGYDMLKCINADAVAFHASKKIAIAGLLLGIVLWFFSFQTIAGEWFGMWMSQWNGLPDATRLCITLFAMLIFIAMKNDD